MNDIELQSECRALMERVPVAFMSTLDEGGFPQTRSVFNLRNREQFASLGPLHARLPRDMMAYVGTNTSSRKVRHVRRDPRVCLYYCEQEAFRGLLLTGTAGFVDDPAIKHALWQPGWEMYYPRGVGDPDFTVLEIMPRSASGWWQGRPFSFSLGGGRG